MQLCKTINKLELAVEDRFIILRLKEDNALLPEGDILENLVGTLGPLSVNYNILCDWRGLGEPTGDVISLINQLSESSTTSIIAKSEEIPCVKNLFNDTVQILQVSSDHHHFAYEPLNLTPFEDEIDFLTYPENTSELGDTSVFFAKYTKLDIGNENIAGFEVFEHGNEAFTLDDAHPEEYIELDRDYIDEFVNKPRTRVMEIEGSDSLFNQLTHYRIKYISDLLQRRGRNSLLSEFVIQECGDDVLVTPYHGYAHYSIEANNQLLIGKPGVIARATGAVFKHEMAGLQRMLSTPNVRESQIQKYLETHPSMLRIIGGGYTEVYPQIILEREDGTSLRPDFILRPSGDDWCDILDIKLPGESVVVGGRDRKRFSAAVEELVAQLREYGAYFENQKLAKRIQDKYGIKCYRPRMIGVIGRQPILTDDRQMRRLETIYSDISIITFDRLVELASKRILI